jgi:ABC-2 type transport system ATP-binding protein
MINIEQINFGYKRKTPILENLSLQFGKGGVYGVLGANGVGKTTLLHLLNGLIFPKKGQISMDNHQPAHRSAAFLERIYYVPVELDLPNIKVSQYCARYAPFYPKFDKKTWEQAIKTFKVDADKKTSALSFGQKKKVIISFALASGCDILLFDEPTDGLDIPSKDSFRSLLSAHTNEERIVIITTHHIHDISTLLDHLVVLQDTSLVVNASISGISEKMYTVTSTHLPASDQLLYSERVLGGYHCLVRNPVGHEGPLDLELLFKALLANPQLLSQ